MEDQIFLPVKVIITTTHNRIDDAIQELQSQTNITVNGTPNVTVLNKAPICEHPSGQD